MAVLQLIGTDNASMPSSMALIRPRISPLSQLPVSSATKGRSPSPSVENMASNS